MTMARTIGTWLAGVALVALAIVRWGEPGASALEATEFSKKYLDGGNPQEGFAALMVCGEADAACPVVVRAASLVTV